MEILTVKAIPQSIEIVTAFADKGNKSVISLSCEDFDITVTIKDNEKFGIYL